MSLRKTRVHLMVIIIMVSHNNIGAVCDFSKTLLNTINIWNQLKQTHPPFIAPPSKDMYMWSSCWSNFVTAEVKQYNTLKKQREHDKQMSRNNKIWLPPHPLFWLNTIFLCCTFCKTAFFTFCFLHLLIFVKNMQ